MATTDRLRRGIRQYQTTTGRRISPEALQALLEAELEVEADRKERAKGLELRERQLEENIRLGRVNEQMTREQMEANRRAARTSGAIQLAGTAATISKTPLGKQIGKGVGNLYTGAKNLITGGTAGTAATSGTAALQAAGGTTAGTGAYAYNPSVLALKEGAVTTGTTAGTSAAGPAVSGTGTATGGGAAEGGAGLGVSWAAAIPAAVALDQYFANRVGNFESGTERWESNARGFRYGGVSPGAAAVIDRYLGGDKMKSSNIEKFGGTLISETLPTELGGSMDNWFMPDYETIAESAWDAITDPFDIW